MYVRREALLTDEDGCCVTRKKKKMILGHCGSFIPTRIIYTVYYFTFEFTKFGTYDQWQERSKLLYEVSKKS